MGEKFEINFKSHIKNGGSILFLLFLAIGFVFVMSIKTNQKIDVFIWISVGMFALFCGPSIIIHLNYYMANRGYTFTYKYNEGEVTIENNERTFRFNIEEIKHVDRFMSYNFSANRAGVLPWDEYNHSVIYLNNGQKFVITSLLVLNLNLPISKDKIEIHKNLYRLVK
ncbi:hypothetical protein ACJVDH_06010 [Pedobacter sp. AW1-32]|uniref:hypothetical protein n=1 Tax=Pedobacter sp. AW1-32 TaxID=3383026 RepID=UPI003FF122E4